MRYGFIPLCLIAAWSTCERGATAADPQEENAPPVTAIFRGNDMGIGYRTVTPGQTAAAANTAQLDATKPQQIAPTNSDQTSPDQRGSESATDQHEPIDDPAERRNAWHRQQAKYGLLFPYKQPTLNRFSNSQNTFNQNTMNQSPYRQTRLGQNQWGRSRWQLNRFAQNTFNRSNFNQFRYNQSVYGMSLLNQRRFQLD